MFIRTVLVGLALVSCVGCSGIAREINYSVPPNYRQLIALWFLQNFELGKIHSARISPPTRFCGLLGCGAVDHVCVEAYVDLPLFSNQKTTYRFEFENGQAVVDSRSGGTCENYKPFDELMRQL